MQIMILQWHFMSLPDGGRLLKLCTGEKRDEGWGALCGGGGRYHTEYLTGKHSLHWGMIGLGEVYLKQKARKIQT